ncbi:MAG: erythromycin esterase family protein [Gaiellaceae bacterium]
METHTLHGRPDDYDPLLDRARDAQFVLVGEASHGTREFYRQRAEITKRLIVEAGHAAVAVEADWPDAYRVNRYVRGESGDETPEEALGNFTRFPTWMWRNTEVVDFVAWLREWNDAHDAKVGFYGLDLYSLHTSMTEVIRYLDEIDPEAAIRARRRYACFDQFGLDPQVYAYETAVGGAEACERQAVQQLVDLRTLAVDGEDRFYAEQNAQLVVDAEEYYRAMFRGGVESWNLRDRHMVDTLERLAQHLGDARISVWAHNSHVGDARATQLGEMGEWNVGQLVRERYPDVHIVGFSTYEGTVTASSDWGSAAERKRVRRALPGSWEELLHETGLRCFLVETAELPGRMLERAIGVIYRPQTERMSHYFDARPSAQFDSLIHLDVTTALEPLEPGAAWHAGRDLAETFPFGV